jgi:haloacetate dehalogenase
MRRHISGQFKIDVAVSDDAMTEYLRTYKNPDTIHAICEDYRASAGIDLEHDKLDQGHLVEAPLLVIWGAKSVVGDLYDVVETWRQKARNVTGFALPCGHAIPEEAPDELASKLLHFFAD